VDRAFTDRRSADIDLGRSPLLAQHAPRQAGSIPQRVPETSGMKEKERKKEIKERKKEKKGRKERKYI
jgi:hypothetical protein